MRRSSRLPARVPVGTKYVVEGRGVSVRRYVEFPDGRRVHLRARRALVCGGVAEQITLVPDLRDETLATRRLTRAIGVSRRSAE
jgi:hypothetical protein